MIIKQLEEYANAMTNATAFTVINSEFKYFDQIAAKLGVNLVGNNNTYTRNKSYFDNSGQNSQIAAPPMRVPSPGDLSSLIG